MSELNPRHAAEHARTCIAYISSFNGQKFSPALDSLDRQNLAMALDHLEEAASMLLNLSHRVGNARRYEFLRAQSIEGEPGKPVIAIPNGMKSGYYVNEETADFAVDAAMLEVTACCGRAECGGECGNEWLGMKQVGAA
jgi:hypothetical protein